MNILEVWFVTETGRSKDAAQQFSRRLNSISMTTRHSNQVVFLVWKEWRRGLYRLMSLRAVLFAADRLNISPVVLAQSTPLVPK
jgi:hypothetical protein